MDENILSFVSSKQYRDKLIAKNLPPYSIAGNFSPPTGPNLYETTLTVSNVIDSPNELISDNPYAGELRPLNKFGPREGFIKQIYYNEPPEIPTTYGQEYTSILETRLDEVNEQNIDAAYIKNLYGPQGGFNALYFVSDLQTTGQIHQPYWSPPSFAPSSYSPYDILIKNNPNGDNGPLSNDSFIAKIGAQKLKSLFEDRIATETYQKTLGIVNVEALQDPIQASLLLSGQQPLLFRDYKITVPENPIVRAGDFLSSLAGVNFPVSPIPGSYFDENTSGGLQTNQTSNALSVVNQATGGLLGPILNLTRNPSQIFLANTGNAQKSILFKNLSYNRYQPQYSKSPGGILGVLTSPLSAVGLQSSTGNYYVGSKNAEPSQITSPPNQIPVDSYGRQNPSPVYGPSELGILYEGNEGKINFGLTSKPMIEGGSITGEFVWTTKKTKGGAGYKPTIGGGIGTIDSEFNQISSSYAAGESTNLDFRKGSILDNTQKLIESADNVSGIKKLKHVGNAINQVSKVFNDGYREITKGSRVFKYTDNTTGNEVGTEYGRVFTKDTPYYTYNDLQKSAGITKEGRRFSYSVLDNTFNLNIAPTKGENSTNIVRDSKGLKYAKKYMFSIENLAWRTSSKPGFTVDELPFAERGPNGGRVMWFPPYDLKFDDKSSANWNPTAFIGRTEPIYTYKDTVRTGSISWSMIVDSPSVLNLIVDQQLKGQTNKQVDSILESFFAGCVKYDLYELAKKFNTFKLSELQQIQTTLTEQNLTREEIESLLADIPKADVVVKKEPEDLTVIRVQQEFNDYAFYFDSNDSQNTIYNAAYFRYTNPLNKDIYTTNSQLFSGTPQQEESYTKDFFTSIVESNNDILTKGNSSFIDSCVSILDKNYEVTVTLQSCVFATTPEAVNKNVSTDRFNSVLEYLKTTKLKKYIDNKSFNLVNDSTLETTVTPKNKNGFGKTVDCTVKLTLPDAGSVVTNTNPNGVSLTQQASASQNFSVSGMACSRTKIKKVDVKKKPEEPADDKASSNPVNSGNQGVNNQSPRVPYKLPPKVDVKTKVRQGIGKKILRSLLTEGDYFEVLQKENPFIYDSIKSQIKYFNPVFHAMTPEGLNSRLTFLNQCVRPGETIPVIGPDGRPKFNDARNTSFGAPPVLVLRIGDFYHTKIIPDNVNFTYEHLDLNPEGIGMQPMIAKVTMGFKYIGGQGIARPVEQLQNALSFNYYANTEIYDERATPTEDTTKIDEEIYNSIALKEKSATLDQLNKQPERRGGKTIGDILTSEPVTSGETGLISYSKVMKTALDNQKQYFVDLLNTAEKISDQYNIGIWQLVTSERNYTTGNFLVATLSGTETRKVEIYGKPFNENEKIILLGKKMVDDIRSKTPYINFIMREMKKTTIFTDNVLDRLSQNFISYIDTFLLEFPIALSNATQIFTLFQQGIVQEFRKLNVVNKLTDGKILENGLPFVYTTSATTEVTSRNIPNVTNTVTELSYDYNNLSLRYQEILSFYKTNGIIPATNDEAYKNTQSEAGNFKPKSTAFGNTDAVLEKADKAMFMLLCRIFQDKNKLKQFKNELMAGDLKKEKKFESKLDSICDDFRDKVLKELEADKKYFEDLKKKQQYIDLKTKDVYPTDPKVTRKFKYTTVPGQSNQTQKDEIKKLWSDQNQNNDKTTWDGKIKFD